MAERITKNFNSKVVIERILHMNHWAYIYNTMGVDYFMKQFGKDIDTGLNVLGAIMRAGLVNVKK